MDLQPGALCACATLLESLGVLVEVIVRPYCKIRTVHLRVFKQLNNEQCLGFCFFVFGDLKFH